MNEFSLIDRIRQQASPDGPGVAVGIGDDAAVLDIEPGFQLVVSTDCLVEGVHFLPDHDAGLTGYKALAVNLSDIAAMGAVPRWALLCISSPAGGQQWIEGTARGVLDLARTQHVTLVGGDISTGPRTVTVTILGSVEAGEALTRDGASPGDLVVISGVTGEAAFALESIRAGTDPGPLALKRLHQPVPRIALGRALVGKASACIDISDGLLADLGHILKASACGAVLEMDKLPSTRQLDSLARSHRWELQTTGGDDYELCFTLPPSNLPLLQNWSQELCLDLTVIGTVCESHGVQCLDSGGQSWLPENTGWEHFS